MERIIGESHSGYEVVDWRLKVQKMSIPAIKQAVLICQKAVNEMDFEKMPKADGALNANLEALGSILRRQTILVNELRRRGYHKEGDDGALHDWLDKDAAPGRKII